MGKKLYVNERGVRAADKKYPDRDQPGSLWLGYADGYIAGYRAAQRAARKKAKVKRGK